ncbi:SDR family oxidoreductase [Actinoplanes sp. NPDC051411]|uniref:SDR family NAD(P)-dependent oxidoreductase n=1 Tax=Actinoplanes sp. NPDC051411 TaxID=3155522 RepID=UPI00342299CB
MLLKDKSAIVYGAAGSVGGTVAQALAAEGARVLLAGRRAAPLEAIAEKIEAAGGTADVATVDALDETAVEAHADAAGPVDISFNAISLPQTGIQGTRIVDLSPEAFDRPIATYTRANFLTARAAARRMTARGTGVILTITASPSRSAVPLMGGMAPAWAAIESLTRGLAAEVGPLGVRVVCINAAGMPETAQLTEVYGLHADAYGITRSQFEARMADRMLSKRLPTIANIADAAAFLASDRAAAITGSVLNLSSGMVIN